MEKEISNVFSSMDSTMILYTTLAFLFGLSVITFLVFSLIPLNSKAAVARGREPEKINVTYLRWLIFAFATFIAWITDVFIVMFAGSHKYKAPIMTISIFMIIIVYKLIFVVYKNFKDLGFNAKGISESAKIITNVLSTKNLDSIIEKIDNENEKI